MVATQAADQSPATSQEIWAILRETAVKQKEYELRWEQESVRRQEEHARRQEEYAKRQKEHAKWQAKSEQEWAELRRQFAETREMFDRTDRQFAETKEMFDRTDRQIARNNSEMGRLRNSFGEVIEHLVAPGLKERFGDLGMDFSCGRIAANMVVSEDGKDVAEADLWLENGQTILVVEVKAKVKMRTWASTRSGWKKYAGRTTSAVIDEGSWARWLVPCSALGKGRPPLKRAFS